MNPQQASDFLLNYLQANPTARPAPQFRIAAPQPVTVAGDTFYLISLVDEAGHPVQNAPTYYVFSDGTVLIPQPPPTPELLETTWLHWKSHTFK